MSKIDRRSVVAGLAALGGIGAAAPAMAAISTAQATQLVNQVVSEINGAINSGRSEGAILSQFEVIFQRYAAVEMISQGILRTEWRSASTQQKRAFSNALKVYLARKYGRRFKEFAGGNIEVQSTRDSRRGYEVISQANLRGQAPFSVMFRVAEIGGQPKFYDIVIEGISLGLVEREEIGAMLDQRRGNLNQLIADLPQAA